VSKKVFKLDKNSGTNRPVQHLIARFPRCTYLQVKSGKAADVAHALHMSCEAPDKGHNVICKSLGGAQKSEDP